MVQKTGAAFIETMDCLPVSKLPEGPEWTYELKLDGYRLEAVRGEKEVTLYSRRRKVLNGRFGYIAKAFSKCTGVARTRWSLSDSSEFSQTSAQSGDSQAPFLLPNRH